MHRALGLLAATIALSACSNTPHNNVLLFGTDTKVALDISSAATQGGAPQITLGYRRAEAVWMPLVANNFNCPAGTTTGCTVTTATAKATSGPYAGEVIPVILSGKDIRGSEGQDAYSVFASFGAKFTGEAAPAAAQASGGLAQFFATGIAAQRIAESDSLEGILKVANPQEAAARAASAESQNIRAAAATTVAQRDLVSRCLSTPAGRTNFLSGVPAANAGDAEFSTATLNGLGTPDDVTSWWRLLNKGQRQAAMTAYASKCTA